MTLVYSNNRLANIQKNIVTDSYLIYSEYEDLILSNSNPKFFAENSVLINSYTHIIEDVLVDIYRMGRQSFSIIPSIIGSPYKRNSVDETTYSLINIYSTLLLEIGDSYRRFLNDKNLGIFMDNAYFYQDRAYSEFSDVYHD